MSKLERRLSLPFGVVAGRSDASGGRGDGGGEELEVVRDMGRRGAIRSRFSRFCN
jgi:hypothetical protein